MNDILKWNRDDVLFYYWWSQALEFMLALVQLSSKPVNDSSVQAYTTASLLANYSFTWAFYDPSSVKTLTRRFHEETEKPPAHAQW